MSLLTIIQGAAVRIGIPKPSTVINNPDANVQQLFEIAQEETVRLATNRAWGNLTVDSTWTTINAENQGPITTVIGGDFDRFVPGTIWDRSLIRPLAGPRSPQGWAQDHALIAAGPFYSFRIIGNNLLIFPVPAAGTLIAWEYISRNFCTSIAGVDQSSWQADTDNPKLDTQMIKLAIVVTYKMVKGLPCEKDLVDFQDRMNDRIAVDSGAPRVLNMSGGRDRYPWPVLPDGNWPTT